MAEQDVVLEFAQHEPFVPAKRGSALAIVGLSASALVHGIAIFTLLHLEPAPAIGAQEIPVDIIVEANVPEPTAVQAPPPARAEPAEAEPPPTSTPTTTENQPPPAPPESAATISPPQPVTQAAPSEPESRPPPDVDPVPAADAAVEAVAPPREPIAAPSAIESSHADAQRREEQQRRTHEEAEAKKKEEKEAAARKRAYAKKREEMRTAARATAAHDREAALERSAAAPPRLTPAPRSDLADYRSAVLRHLTAFTHYPESARERGVHGQTIIAFTLDAAGHVVSAHILHSSGQADIDAETLAMVRRADPFPRPPPGAERSFSPAIEFHLE